MADQPQRRITRFVLLGVLCLVGLAFRLAVWRWREFYPLGGDEQEYLQVALTLLRERRYEELRLMRPPLYPIFLAAAIYLVDSLVQHLRLVQALISTATIPFVYLLSYEIAQGEMPRAGAQPAGLRRLPWIAALPAALSYTLAANATELLSETLFLGGLTVALWLLLRAGRLRGLHLAALAGLSLGALCLVRSVALPLLPLGAFWLVISARPAAQQAAVWLRPALLRGGLLMLAGCLVIMPWTVRNYLTYGGLILIDTTGAENLWLDNDPAGREAVKAQLYAMGDERLARQQLAATRGVAVILGEPGRFVSKAWDELRKLFALEYADDMRARPAIWIPPLEVWVRLIFGDGLWLGILLAGSYGLARAAVDDWRLMVAGRAGRSPGEAAPAEHRRPLGALLLFTPWVLYIVLTAMVFHVELRYRLPLYPVLLPYAALALAGGTRRRSGGKIGWFVVAAPLACLALTLLHRPYPVLAWQLAGKHLALARAAAALKEGEALRAEAAGVVALNADAGSALARIVLARAALLRGDEPAAIDWLREAMLAVPQHPYAHLLYGDLLRRRGDLAAARSELAFETGSLEDLQAWSWRHFGTLPPAQLALGDGLDLGFIQGFHALASGESGFRWSHGKARVRLTADRGARRLMLRMASGRPDGGPVMVEVLVGGRLLERLPVGADWQEYSLALPAGLSGELLVELRSPTFTPRDYDRASPDGRRLGIMLAWVEVSP